MTSRVSCRSEREGLTTEEGLVSRSSNGRTMSSARPCRSLPRRITSTRRRRQITSDVLRAGSAMASYGRLYAARGKITSGFTLRGWYGGNCGGRARRSIYPFGTATGSSKPVSRLRLTGVWDAYDNAPAGTNNGLSMIELIRRRGPLEGRGSTRYKTLPSNG
jgi:hypothetical protein